MNKVLIGIILFAEIFIFPLLYSIAIVGYYSLEWAFFLMSISNILVLIYFIKIINKLKINKVKIIFIILFTIDLLWHVFVWLISIKNTVNPFCYTCP